MAVSENVIPFEVDIRALRRPFMAARIHALLWKGEKLRVVRASWQMTLKLGN